MILAAVALGRYPHVCAFFEDRDEEYACFLPFIREAIEAGEKAFHVVDPALRDDHLERLRQGGIDVEQTQRKGQPVLRAPRRVHGRGTFPTAETPEALKMQAESQTGGIA